MLGPILFLLYINVLPEEFSDIQLTLLADDTSVLQNYKSDTGFLIANEILKKVSNWFEKHKLMINTSKTYIVEFLCHSGIRFVVNGLEI